MRPTHTASKSDTATRTVPLADITATVLVLGMFSAALAAGTAMSFRAGLMPRFAAILGIAATVLHLVILVVASLRKRNHRPDSARLDEPDRSEEPDDEYSFATAGRRRWTITAACIATFFIILYLTGAYVTAVVFSIGYLKAQANKSWLFAIIYGAILGAVLYLVFNVALSLDLPAGLLDLQ